MSELNVPAAVALGFDDCSSSPKLTTRASRGAPRAWRQSRIHGRATCSRPASRRVHTTLSPAGRSVSSPRRHASGVYVRGLLACFVGSDVMKIGDPPPPPARSHPRLLNQAPFPTRSHSESGGYALLLFSSEAYGYYRSTQDGDAARWLAGQRTNALAAFDIKLQLSSVAQTVHYPVSALRRSDSALPGILG